MLFISNLSIIFSLLCVFSLGTIPSLFMTAAIPISAIAYALKNFWKSGYYLNYRILFFILISTVLWPAVYIQYELNATYSSILSFAIPIVYLYIGLLARSIYIEKRIIIR